MSIIAILNLKENINIEILQGSCGKYYRILENNYNLLAINYDIHFPLEWALFKNSFLINGEIYNTGPNYCKNCQFYGFHNGVFLGYCMNCAEVFNFTRGNGMTDLYKEVDENMVAFDLTNFKKENSIWNTYLKDISLNEIGDEKLKEEYEMYKDLPDLISIKEENDEENDNKSNYSQQFLDSDEENDYEVDNYYINEDEDEDEKLNSKIDKLMCNRKFDRKFDRY